MKVEYTFNAYDGDEFIGQRHGRFATGCDGYTFADLAEFAEYRANKRATALHKNGRAQLISLTIVEGE